MARRRERFAASGPRRCHRSSAACGGNAGCISTGSATVPHTPMYSGAQRLMRAKVRERTGICIEMTHIESTQLCHFERIRSGSSATGQLSCQAAPLRAKNVRERPSACSTLTVQPRYADSQLLHRDGAVRLAGGRYGLHEMDASVHRCGLEELESLARARRPKSRRARRG